MFSALVGISFVGCESSGGGKAVDPGPRVEDPFASRNDGSGEAEPFDWGSSPQIQDPAGRNNAGTGVEETYWTIALGTFSTGDHASTARAFLMEVSSQTGLTGLGVHTSETGSIVHTGRYPNWSDPRAKSDLERIKALNVGGRRMFSGAFLAPVTPSRRVGQFPQYHLSMARKMFPNQEVLYTLQIGIYEAEDRTTLEEARRLCEDGARQLRADGEMAFYYHGLDQSTLTVGVFFANAIDSATNVYSAEVRSLQQRFPHNSLNGRQLLETIRRPGGQVQKITQPSVLVVVPRE